MSSTALHEPSVSLYTNSPAEPTSWRPRSEDRPTSRGATNTRTARAGTGFQIETFERFRFSPAVFLPADPHILGVGTPSRLAHYSLAGGCSPSWYSTVSLRRNIALRPSPGWKSLERTQLVRLVAELREALGITDERLVVRGYAEQLLGANSDPDAS